LDERVLFIEEPPNIESAFRALSCQQRQNSKNWADAYLAAFAAVSGMKLMTFDQGFQRKVEKLLILSR
jgi:predicted nucleic acid-binding protein